MKGTYFYTAKDSPGNLVRGTLTATSINDALGELEKEGLVPVEISLSPGQGLLQNAVSRISAKDVLSFTRQLANLVGCDLPLVTGLRLMAKRNNTASVTNLAEGLAGKIEDGAMLSEALAGYPAFQRSYVHMVESGELGGRLPETLHRIADFLDEEQERRTRIRGALAYPLFVLGVGILTITVMLTFVVPRMSGLFEEFHASLPWPTQVLLSASQFLCKHWIVIILIFGIIAAGLSCWLSSAEGRIKWDRTMLRLPLYGHFFYQTEMTRMLRTLAMLLDSGVDAVAALSAARDVARNSVLKEGMRSVIDEVAGGSSLSKALVQHKVFDETTAGLVNIGEESGDLPKNLNQLADMHERETAAASAAFLTLLGPAFLLVIVGFTGFVVAALLLPVLQMDLMVR